MAEHEAVDNAGTPRANRLYAVFESERDAQRAEIAMRALGAPASKLTDPEPLQGGSGIIGTIARLVKGAGVEQQEADRYATHLQHGQTVLTVPVQQRDHADRLAQVLAQQGGFDITFYSDMTIEEMSPRASARHGVPAHDAGAEVDTSSAGRRADEQR